MNPARSPIAAVGIAVALVLAALAGVAYSGTNDWAAKVNGREISEREFLRELEQFRDNPELAQFFPGLDATTGAVPAQLAGAWLGRLIQQDLVDAELTRRGDVDVTEANRQEAEQINLQQFQGAQVFEAFSPWFRDRMIERDARFLAMVGEVSGTPTEAELRAEYDANPDDFTEACAAHILVETRDEADAVVADLAAGADFAALAAERSQDPGSAPNGGDLGCAPRGTYVAPFDEAVFELPVGEVSDPVETQFGFHVIKVESRETRPFEFARDELRQRLQARSQQDFSAFLFELVSDAEIEVNPKYGSFEIGPNGPTVVPPVRPDPPQGLPTDGADDAVTDLGNLIPTGP